MIYSLIRRWARSIHGHTAVIFALMALPMFILVGAAIDVARQVGVDQKLERATDMAALIGARHLVKTGNASDSATKAYKAFAENIKAVGQDVSCSTVSAVSDTTALTFNLKAKCELPTIFGAGITGMDMMAVNSSAEAQGSITTLDMALVMDTSSSMSSAAITSLKTSAKSLVDRLITSDDNVRISLVPYAESVNPGSVGFTALNRDPSDPASVTDPEGDGVDKFCVTERVGAEAATDAVPALGAYMGEPNTITRHCNIVELLPLEDDADDLKDHIDLLARPLKGNGTAGQVGIAWGWYTLSPKWATIWPAGSEPKAYGNPDEIKAIVIMTDGVYNLYDALGNPGPGYPRSPAQTRSLCAAMKSEGIIIFTVAFNAPPAAETLMQNCATSAGHYFDAADTTALENAYAAIASRFNGVAITK